MRNAVTSQLVRHYLPRFTTVVSKQSFEKALSSRAISFGLQKYIHHLAILINRSPQIVLLATDLNEDFINIERIAETLVPTVQALYIFGPELVTPQANRFVTYDDTSFSQQIFDISLTQVEPMI